MSKERALPNTSEPREGDIFDRDKFLEIRDMLKRLEDMGVKRKEYEIGFPYSPRPIRPERPEREGKKGYDIVSPFGGRKVCVIDTTIPQKIPRGRMR